MSKEAEDLREENDRLTGELEDLRILNETTVEHSTALENELVDQNQLLAGLQNKMKKYLSPQLYEALVGGMSDASLAHTRKKLTIFFSDIVRFSEMTDSIESELLSEVLNQYLNGMANIANKWGGTIDKFIGDSVMVFFGDPDFIDDATHARNCVNMAVEMREQLKQLRAKWRDMGLFHQFKVRMGINTGYCTVGNFGSNNRMDYTIVGGQVNIASRLESIAEPDSIYISHATAALIQDIVDCEYVNDVTVKGIHYPIEVYRVLGLKGSGVSSSSLCKITKSGFIISNLEFDAESTTSRECEEIIKALQSALNRIQGDDKRS